jgi:exodeoxyribonuclease V
MTETKPTIHSFLQFNAPTVQQTQALEAMQIFVAEECTEDFLILSGAAGTGKTSITTALIGYLNHEKIEFEICAPTGRAARILGRKSNVMSNTIHSTIFDISTETDTGKVICTIKKPSMQNKEPKIFIIDEASMIGSTPISNEDELFDIKTGLLDAIMIYIKRVHPQSKVIFLGDRNQLAPMHEQDSKALNKAYIELKYSYSGNEYFLTEVMRQQQGSILMDNAIATRIAIENNNGIAPIQCHQKMPSLYAGADSYVQHYNDTEPGNAIAIGCTHKGNLFFNDMVRQRLYGKQVAQIEIGDFLLVTKTWERDGVRLYSGDHVIVKNFDKNGIVKAGGFDFMPVELTSTNLQGEPITITDYMRLDLLRMPKGTNLVTLENKLRQERYIKNPIFRKSKHPRDDRYVGALALTYGHAITCNKAQGGEWHTVFLNTFTIPSLRWQYTSVTRAMEKLIVF